MEIEKGLNPNCSETVYRFNQNILDEYRSEIENMCGSMTFEPEHKQIAMHYEQSFGQEMMDFLEEKKIPYSTDQWLCTFDQYEHLFEKVGDGVYVRKPY